MCVTREMVWGSGSGRGNVGSSKLGIVCSIKCQCSILRIRDMYNVRIDWSSGWGHGSWRQQIMLGSLMHCTYYQLPVQHLYICEIYTTQVVMNENNTYHSP